MGTTSHENVGGFAQAWHWFKALPKKIKESVTPIMILGKDDPRRVSHAFKVGLALVVVALFCYFDPLYTGFGDSAIYAVLTVVVVFEFYVGLTLGKCLNRGLATLVAAALGVGAQQLAILTGKKGEPIMLTFLVFLSSSTATFSRFFPRVKARYDYGVMIFILTFDLVAVSGYRSEILGLAYERFVTVVIGALICVIISVGMYPVWAGEELHNLVALNIEKVADFLEGFGLEYFGKEGDEYRIASNKVTSSLNGYKSVLNSKATEESLANFSRWEPSHGKFKLRLPWKQYLKVATLTRQCAYHVEALNRYINSNIQVSKEFKSIIQESCTRMSAECGMALKKLASGIRAMAESNASKIHITNSRVATNDLKTILRTALPANTDLTPIIPAATVASLLIEIVACTETIADSVQELARLSGFTAVNPSVSQILHQGTVNPDCDMNGSDVDANVDETSICVTENVKPQEYRRHTEMGCTNNGIC